MESRKQKRDELRLRSCACKRFPLSNKDDLYGGGPAHLLVPNDVSILSLSFEVIN